MLYRYALGEKGVCLKGMAVCKALSTIPQTLEEITATVLKNFPKNDPGMLKSEIESFLVTLEKDNIIVSGNDKDELKEKDVSIAAHYPVTQG
jgi:hypothetical protein